MGTEILRPHDFWNDGFRQPPRRRNFYPHNSRPFRKPTMPPRSDQRRKSPSPVNSPSPFSSPVNSPSPYSSPANSPPPSPTPKPPMRRTASAVELNAHMQPENWRKKGKSLDTIDATRMKRDMRKKCMNDTYAGSAFFTSPAPSSLPQPSFFSENNTNIISIATIISTAVKHESATRDLRRMLGLK